MKISRLGMTALLVGGLVLSNSIAHAQSTSSNQTTPPKAAAKAPATAQSRVDKVGSTLKLTPEQKAALLPVFQEEIDKRAEITKRRAAEREQVRLDFLAKVKASGKLTDAQYAQFLKLEKPAAAKPITAKPATPKPTTN